MILPFYARGRTGDTKKKKTDKIPDGVSVFHGFIKFQGRRILYFALFDFVKFVAQLKILGISFFFVGKLLCTYVETVTFMLLYYLSNVLYYSVRV